MAKRQKIDRLLASQMEEIERRIYLLKINYEKYFSGVDSVEPLRDKDDLKRQMMEISRRRIVTTRERHKWNSLKSRMTSLEQYWKRNLLMIERGTHPKMQFRANRRAAQKGGTVNTGIESRLEAQRQAREQSIQDEVELRRVYDRFVSARKKCGQDADLNYRAVRQVLRGQARTIRSRYRCEDVKFKVTVEKGQAKVKAVPVKD